MTYSRHTNEEVIAAYRETGSVWAAGRKIGLSGQTVHGRLRAIGVKTGGAWSSEEVERLRELSGQRPIGQIADEMGRSYASIACKINELGTGSRAGNRIMRKIPRGQGFDKASVKKYLVEIEASGEPITRWAKQHGMIVDTLIRAIENHYPEWWIEYRNRNSDLPQAVCPNPSCGTLFYPSNSRQTYCRRLCSSQHKADRDYFGGKRGNTVGLAEGVCQICGNKPRVGISSHHVFGKENDQENDWLVALCRGCHQLVTLLGGRNFEAEHWEALVSFAWLRKHGDKSDRKNTLLVSVSIDNYDEEEE